MLRCNACHQLVAPNGRHNCPQRQGTIHAVVTVPDRGNDFFEQIADLLDIATEVRGSLRGVNASESSKASPQIEHDDHSNTDSFFDCDGGGD